MTGRRKAILALSAVALVSCCTTVVAVALLCRRTRPIPHDPKRARYVLDVVPSPRSIYQDEELRAGRQFDCWDADGSTRMAHAEGEHVTEYAVRRKGGALLKHIRATSCSYGFDLTGEDGSPPPEGGYTLDVAVRLPSGRTITGGYTRDFQVRRRELRLGIESHKEVHRVGEEIRLVVFIENIFGRRIDFAELGPAEITIRDTYSGDSFRTTVGTPLGWGVLEPGEEARILELKFMAGRADPRFVPGPRSECFPGPFARIGSYTLECSAKIRKGVTPHRAGVRPWLLPLAGSVTITVNEP